MNLIIVQILKALSEGVCVRPFVLVDMIRLYVVIWNCSLCYLITAESNERDKEDGDTASHSRDGQRDERLSLGCFCIDEEDCIIIKNTVVDCLNLKVTGSIDGIYI